MLTSTNINDALSKLTKLRQQQKEFIAAMIVTNFEAEVENQPRIQSARFIADVHDQASLLRNVNDLIGDLTHDLG